MKKGMPGWLVLTVIALIAGFALSVTYELTKDTIALQQEAQALQARQTFFPGAEFNALDVQESDGVDACYEALENGEVTGYVITVTVKGYGGEIEVIAGVGKDQMLRGITVGGAGFSETAGMGAKTRDAAFTDQFQAIAAPVTLQESVDAVTGATVSSNAVVSAVNMAAAYAQLLG